MVHRFSSRPGLAACAVVGFALTSVYPQPARAQVSAEESAKSLKPAAGLEATLWAAEPMVVNPTNMDVDSRGRVWVSEGLNYRLTHAGKPFKKVEHADKIKILEDTDGDGKADKVTVFADDIYPIPMGLAVEERYGTDGRNFRGHAKVLSLDDLRPQTEGPHADSESLSAGGGDAGTVVILHEGRRQREP